MQKPFQFHADTIISACRGDQHVLDCYNKQILKLIEPPYSISMEDAFQVTRLVQKTSSEYLYCYELGYQLGAKETAKNPTKWKSVLSRCPATMCNNACLHGVLMEGSKAKQLSESATKIMINDLRAVCRPSALWRPVKIETNMCYYGLGDRLLNLTGHDLSKAARLCKDFESDHGDPFNTFSCIRGVFMSMYQHGKNMPSHPDEVTIFCNQFQNDERSACFNAAWQRSIELISQPSGAVKLCSYAQTPQEVKRCYSAILQGITVSLDVYQNNDRALGNYCLGMPEGYQGFCFGTVASRLLLVDPNYYAEKAVWMCVAAQKSGFAKDCYTMLIDYAAMNFHKGSLSAGRFCDRLPSNWKAQCRNKLL